MTRVTTPTRWHIDIPGTRIDAFPWRIEVLEFAGSEKGPATAVLSGITGDKPLGILAMHDLAGVLKARAIAGTILVIACANPYGFQAGTRHDPDLVELNRRFPGTTYGLLSDQVAHALMSALVARVGTIIDVHSGTAVRTTEYIYEYGNLALAASFGNLPVMTGRAIPGQLCTEVSKAGLQSALIEFGGPDRNTTATAVAGCLNMLRFLGHIDDAPTGPDKVAVIDRVKRIIASHDGILESALGPADVGATLQPGVLAWVTSATTGERLETFHIEAVGSTAGPGYEFDTLAGVKTRPFVVDALPVLLLAQTVPSLVRPGNLLFLAGWVSEMMPTPRRH